MDLEFHLGIKFPLAMFYARFPYYYSKATGYNFAKLYENAGVNSKEELEQRLRPGQYSVGGFLAASDDFEATVLEDIATLEKFNIEYYNLGKTLYQITLHDRIFNSFTRLNPDAKVPNPYFLFNGKKFFSSLQEFDGAQLDPFFNDPKAALILGNKIYTFWKVDDNHAHMLLSKEESMNQAKAVLTVDGGVIDLITRYAFFEGKNSPHRVDPENILRFFELI